MVLKMNKLSQYMKVRAKFENAKWELTDQQLSFFHKKGIRNFFGVLLDDNGNILEDTKQPSFFKSYKSASIN